MLTEEEVKKALPANMRTVNVTDLTSALNSLQMDPEAADNIRNNFVSYTGILREGKFKLEDYLNAVAFCSFKIMGYNNQESYQRTFPQRYQNLAQRGTSAKDIAAYVSAYAKGKLVNLILEQAMIPTWVLNQDMFQKALNEQFTLMTSAKSEMVRMQAANSILTHLKKPESKDFKLKIDTNESDGLKDLKDTLQQLAVQQRDLIEAGVSTQKIAHAPLVIEGKVNE